MPLLLGGITMWSGLVEDIPAGFALCDGTNGTLDLRNRFVVGAGALYSVADTGGLTDAVVVQHNHGITINSGGGHNHVMYGSDVLFAGSVRSLNAYAVNRSEYKFTQTSGGGGAHSHSVTINNSSSVSATNRNLPPYYALAFIQQIE